MAYLLGFKVEEIYLYPLGGISKFKMDLNTSSKKEFLILIMGPIFQGLAYLFLIYLFPSKEHLIKLYHMNILYFNLLPIYPLDGGKLWKLLLEKLYSYQLSLKGILLISYLVLLIILYQLHPITINTLIIILFLITLITKEYKKINIIYQKFLLERYLKDYSFKKSKIITSEKDFYRGKSHLIKQNNRYVLEKEYLTEKYKNHEKS